jgi:hypothetical protein
MPDTELQLVLEQLKKFETGQTKIQHELTEIKSRLAVLEHGLAARHSEQKIGYSGRFPVTV